MKTLTRRKYNFLVLMYYAFSVGFLSVAFTVSLIGPGCPFYIKLVLGLGVAVVLALSVWMAISVWRDTFRCSVCHQKLHGWGPVCPRCAEELVGKKADGKKKGG